MEFNIPTRFRFSWRIEEVGLKEIAHTFTSHVVVLGTAALALPGSLVEFQSAGPHIRPTASESHEYTH